MTPRQRLTEIVAEAARILAAEAGFAAAEDQPLAALSALWPWIRDLGPQGTIPAELLARVHNVLIAGRNDLLVPVVRLPLFVQTVARMRRAQKGFVDGGDRTLYQQAEELEATVDRWLAEIESRCAKREGEAETITQTQGG